MILNSNIEYTFTDGKKVVLKCMPWHRTYVHAMNGHKTRAKTWDGPAPWLGNAVGGHTKPFSFIQTYCITCEEKRGLTYLDKFSMDGDPAYPEMTEYELRKEVELINEVEKS